MVNSTLTPLQVNNFRYVRSKLSTVTIEQPEFIGEPLSPQRLLRSRCNWEGVRMLFDFSVDELENHPEQMVDRLARALCETSYHLAA